jgi:hypothetical protein
MPQILLHIPQRHACFQQMGCITVPEMTDRHMLVNARFLLCIPECDLNTGYGNGDFGDGHFGIAASSRCRKDPDRISVHSVEGSKDIKGSLG